MASPDFRFRFRWTSQPPACIVRRTNALRLAAGPLHRGLPRYRGTAMTLAHPGSAAGLFRDYTLTGYDEMFASPGEPRPHYAASHSSLAALGPDDLETRSRLADRVMKTQGITFTVYGRGRASSGSSRSTRSPGSFRPTNGPRSSAALEQRVRALNLFIHDVYHDPPHPPGPDRPARVGLRRQRLSAGVRRSAGAAGHLHPRLRHRPDPRSPTAATSCSRTTGRTPSGVSYVLKNRAGDEAGLPVPVRRVQRPAGGRLHRRICSPSCGTSPRPAATIRRSSS